MQYFVQLPLLWIHISKLRYLFCVKIVLMPIFGFTLFGWAVGRAGGFGPVFSNTTNHITDGSGRTAAVVFFSAMTSAIAPKATLSLNICDFSKPSLGPVPSVCHSPLARELTSPPTLRSSLRQVFQGGYLDQHLLTHYSCHPLRHSRCCCYVLGPGYLRRVNVVTATGLLVDGLARRPVLFSIHVGYRRSLDQHQC
jgi:hypothetical protein